MASASQYETAGELAIIYRWCYQAPHLLKCAGLSAPLCGAGICQAQCKLQICQNAEVGWAGLQT